MLRPEVAEPMIALSAAGATALERLTIARRTATPCTPVRDLLPAEDIEAAYAVQRAAVLTALAGGRRVVGRKIGLTNPAVQAQLGVDQPDFGFLLDDMRCGADEPIDPGRLLQPRIEAEVAVILAADLDDPGIDEAGVRAAVGGVAPALEIVDSRIAGWDIAIVDTVADNASSGLFVLGDTRPLADLDLRPLAMSMRRGSDLVSTGSGTACLGDPLTAVAWLARTAHRLGAPLRAGEIVLSGALGPMVPVVPGDVFTASIDEIGSVRARFASHPA